MSILCDVPVAYVCSTREPLRYMKMFTSSIPFSETARVSDTGFSGSISSVTDSLPRSCPAMSEYCSL